VHLALGVTPTAVLSDIVRDVKAGSSGFINSQRWIRGRFTWQEGFGAISFARADLDSVVRYIMNQEEHHRAKTFREEYLELLQEFAVQYDLRYVFAPVASGQLSAGLPEDV
jgi:hypothetical protein